MEYCSARAKFASFSSAAPTATELHVPASIAPLSKTESSRLLPLENRFISFNPFPFRNDLIGMPLFDYLHYTRFSRKSQGNTAQLPNEQKYDIIDIWKDK